MNIIFYHHSGARNSKMTDQIWPLFELVRDFMPVLVIYKFDGDWQSLTKIRFKVTENTRGHSFAHYMVMGAFCCHGNHSFNPICPKT